MDQESSFLKALIDQQRKKSYSHQRTPEQMATELELINSVLAGLVAQIDIQGIYELVGDKIREVFDAQVVLINTFDLSLNITTPRYLIEMGERYYLSPTKMGPAAKYLCSNGKTVLLNTLAEINELGMHTIKGTQEIKSGVWVPLIVGKEIKGSISLQNIDREYAFSETDVRLLETLANSMSLALESARLFEETQQRNAELAIINSVGEAMSQNLDVETITRIVGDKVQGIFNAEVVMIGLIDEQSGILRLPYSYDEGKHEKPDPVPLGVGLSALMFKSRAPLRLNTLEELKDSGAVIVTVNGVDTPKIESWLGVPIIVGDKVIGGVSVQSRQQYAFDANNERLLSTLAANMGVAIENARLFEETNRLLVETQQRNAELAIINSVQRGLASQLNMQAIYDLVGDKICNIFPDAESVAIGWFDPGTKTRYWYYVIEKGLRYYPAPDHYAGKPYETWFEQVANSREPLVYNEGLHEFLIENGIPLVEGTEEPKSAMFVPMLVGGKIIGQIDLQNMTREHAFSDSDIRLLTTLANSASVALENARLFDETQRLLEETEQRAAELETVNTVSQALASETGLDALIQLIGEQLRAIFDADIVYIALHDRESNLINFPYNFGEEYSTIKYGEGLTSKILESGKPLLINSDMEERRAMLGTRRVGKKALSYLGVPVIVGGQPIGAISVQSTQMEERFNDEDMRLLSTIAANVGTAIRNATLFDEIKRQKTYNELVIANSPAAIVVMDRNLTVTGWNPAAERLFGYTREEAVGMNVDLLVANRADVYAEAANYSEQQLRDNQIHFFSKRTRKDGSLVEVEVMGLPVVEDGQFTGYVVIYHDISELQRARQEAIQANEAKSAFLANMSHELRTPLNAIIGFTRIVRRKGEETLPEKQLQNLDKVLVSAEHLLGLINSVLDLSKIEAGRMDVELSSFQIGPLVELVMATTQPLVRGDKVRLVCDMPPGLPPLYSDAEKLKQILLNLLSNAAKFTHEGKITISMRQADGMLKISVTDTGIGISPEAMQHIFEEFQQADISTTREYGGTGLGLSISRSLARLLGGDLTAESQLGQGSTFTLNTPFNYSEQPAAPAGETYPQDQPPLLPGHTPLVLVIDDDGNSISLLKEELGEGGYQVIGALNGADGLRLARQLLPFAITLDIKMPQKDGWQVLHDLKADPLTRHIPVIMVTIVDKKALGFRLGAADYLVKPLDEDEVLASLSRLAETSNGGLPRRVLVVDDDPGVIELVTQLLEGSGYSVEPAADGEQAVKQALRSPPDVVLLDLLMPRLDGFGVIDILQSQPATSRIPIIILTAKSLTEDEAEALRKSTYDILHKNGLEGEMLIRQIEEALLPEQAARATG